VADRQVLSPEQWDTHISQNNMPDTYIKYILEKIKETKSSKIVIIFEESATHGSIYKVREDSDKHESTNFYSRRNYVSIAEKHI